MSHESRVINSALWAAYGDALGFITELADARIVRTRTGGREITTTQSWTRRIGGRFGVDVQLPAGCYSDDTQLRLSTSRAIRGNGSFDVEAFSKVELPVWLAYQLGGGRGTKAAAAALGRRSVSWFNNFFEKPVRYVDAGGNGAAMRVQPHVWCAREPERPETYLLDVIRNSLCTHGHPRGFVGAAFHAVLLGTSVARGSVPSPEIWGQLLNQLRIIPDLIASDDQLVSFWAPTWERATGTTVVQAINETLTELRSDIGHVRAWLSGDHNYAELVDTIGGFSPEHRGSGTKCVVLSLALAWKHRLDPASATHEAALCIGSDTDSIATLAAAILGAVSEKKPPGPIADQSYIVQESTRLSDIVGARKMASFRYPNLLKWTPPSPANVIGMIDGSLGVAGLGHAVESGNPIEAKSKNPVRWQWVVLEFGQRILARVSDPLPQLKPVQLPDTQVERPVQSTVGKQVDLFTPGVPIKHPAEQRVHSASASNERRRLSLDEATQRVVDSRFDSRLIGELLLDFAQGDRGIEDAIAFSAIVAKARIARMKKSDRSSEGENSRPNAER